MSGLQGPMAPWDEQGWFDLPQITTVTVVSGAVPVLLADPRRVLIVWSVPAGAPGGQLGLSQNVTGTTGLTITSSSPPFIVNQSWMPGLVANEWWFAGTAGARVTAITVSLRAWPADTPGGLLPKGQ